MVFRVDKIKSVNKAESFCKQKVHNKTNKHTVSVSLKVNVLDNFFWMETFFFSVPHKYQKESNTNGPACI